MTAFPEWEISALWGSHFCPNWSIGWLNAISAKLLEDTFGTLIQRYSTSEDPKLETIRQKFEKKKKKIKTLDLRTTKVEYQSNDYRNDFSKNTDTDGQLLRKWC